MNRILLLLLVVVVPFIGYGQCKKKEKKDFNGHKYHGCLNDAGKPHGEGTLKFKSGDKYSGEWKDGIRNGEGTYTWTDGDKYVGEFRNGKRNGEGTMTHTNGNQYVGEWKDGKKNGEGIMISLFDSQTQTSKGEFKFDILYNGTETIDFNNGHRWILTYKEGEKINQWENIKNYYKPEDIIGERKETIVTLEQKDNHYFIDFDINGISCEGFFDTGAFGLKIGNRLYQRLISEGVKVHDLNMEVITKGIGGVSHGGYVKFEEITIGEYTVKDVIATFSLDQDYTLIGTQFFEKFRNVQWDMREKTLKLYR